MTKSEVKQRAILHAMASLRIARDVLANAYAAPNTLARIRSALKSAEGALRHENNAYARARAERQASKGGVLPLEGGVLPIRLSDGRSSDPRTT